MNMLKISPLTPILLSLSLNVFAWESVEDAKITEFVQFNTGIDRDYSIAKFEQDGGAFIRCHVSYEEKEFTSLIISLYMSGKSATVHCYNEELDIGGIKSYKLHRVIAK
ncbi:hypothetical protein ACJJIF_02380 [Microbulbifer sp. SSSA002]|uniref:hypothetical protein n=1 Tax=Microbulbifer sp. SSSA002 TaxID=3243376 RepID=UPI00403A10CE